MSSTSTRTPSRTIARDGRWLSSLFGREGHRWALATVVVWLEVAFFTASSAEPDTFWEARAGLESLQGAGLPRVDTWSWSTFGAWYPNSPAWNVVLALGWRLLGWWGFVAVAIITGCVLMMLILAVARRAGAKALPTLAVVLPLIVVGGLSLSGRATTMVMVLLVLSAWFADVWARRAHRLRLWMAVVGACSAGFILSFVGNWIHLSFLAAAPLVAVAWAIAWWFASDLGRRLRVLMALGGALGLFLGCVASPYGIPLTITRSEAVNAACQGIVTEWMSVVAAVRDGHGALAVIALLTLIVACGAALIVITCLRRNGSSSRGIVSLVALTVMAVPPAMAGLGAVRFSYPSLFLSMPVLAVGATALFRRIRKRITLHSPNPHSRLFTYTSDQFWSWIVAVVGIVMIPVSCFVVVKDAVPAPVSLASELPRGCNLYSDPGTAGSILLYRPDVKVWIDGRADFYGRAHILEYAKIAADKAPIPDGTTCIMLYTITNAGTTPSLAATIDRSPDWKRISQSDHLAVWVRSQQHSPHTDG